MSLTERLEVVKSNGLCLGCLRYGHMKNDCRGRKVCTTCNGFHPTSLHIDTPRVPQQGVKSAVQPQSTPKEATSHRVNTHDSNVSTCNSHSLIVPVWLHHKDNLEKRELVYALLDDQSDACFVRDDVIKRLGISGPDVQLKLSTVVGENVVLLARRLKASLSVVLKRS